MNLPKEIIWSSPTSCLQIPPSDEPIFGGAKRRLEQTTCGASLWFDGLFGEHGDINGARRTRGRVELSALYSDFKGYDTRIRFYINFNLQTLENRLSAFIGRDNEEDFVRGRSEGFALRSQFPRLDEDDQWLAGLGYGLPSTKRLQTSFRIGVRSLRLPKIFVQARLAYNAYANEKSVVHLRATPFWTNRDGIGITTSGDYSYVLSNNRLLRWNTTGTVSQKTVGLDWRSALIHYHNVKSLGALAYEAFVRGATAEPVPLVEYGVRTVHRYPLISETLYSELVLGYSWPRTDPALSRDGSFEVGAGLEMPFGKN